MGPTVGPAAAVGPTDLDRPQPSTAAPQRRASIRTWRCRTMRLAYRWNSASGASPTGSSTCRGSGGRASGEVERTSGGRRRRQAGSEGGRRPAQLLQISSHGALTTLISAAENMVSPGSMVRLWGLCAVSAAAMVSPAPLYPAATASAHRPPMLGGCWGKLRELGRRWDQSVRLFSGCLGLVGLCSSWGSQDR